MTLVKLEPAASRSRVKHSTTEPLRSLLLILLFAGSNSYGQSDQSLSLSVKNSMNIKQLIKHHLEFLRLKGDCKGSSEFVLG